MCRSIEKEKSYQQQKPLQLQHNWTSNGLDAAFKGAQDQVIIIVIIIVIIVEQIDI